MNYLFYNLLKNSSNKLLINYLIYKFLIYFSHLYISNKFSNYNII